MFLIESNPNHTYMFQVEYNAEVRLESWGEFIVEDAQLDRDGMYSKIYYDKVPCNTRAQAGYRAAKAGAPQGALQVVHYPRAASRCRTCPS